MIDLGLIPEVFRSTEHFKQPISKRNVISRGAVFAFLGIQGSFRTELHRYGVYGQNEDLRLEFVTSNKPPDFFHVLPNGTKTPLIVNGFIRHTAEASSCDISVNDTVTGGGYIVRMSCPAALPLLAGTYIGTDNDDAVNALRTFADVVIVSGACMKVRQIGSRPAAFSRPRPFSP